MEQQHFVTFGDATPGEPLPTGHWLI